MMLTYFKIAWRNLWKNKGYATINIVGLAIGMTAVLLIGIWVQNQFQFDNFYSNKDNLYRLWNKYEDKGEISMQKNTSGKAAPALEADFPEVAHTARVYWSSPRLLSFNDKKIKSIGTEVDPSFLQMFDIKILKGNRNKSLEGQNNIVLTESLAQKIFGETDPLNKTLLLNNEDSYIVSGIMADLPGNTNFNFNYLIPLTNPEKYSPNWNHIAFMTYIQLKDGTDVEAFNKKLVNIIAHKTNNELKGSLFLYPISKMHLYSKFVQGIPVGGKIEQVKLVAGIGFLILIIACINFINLSTARSQKRAKEVAVRKVVGAQRTSLITQFLTESILLATLSGMLALGLTTLAMPLFNQVLGMKLGFSMTDPMIWISLVGCISLTGILAGSYPAFVLSSFKPIQSLKAFGKSKTFNLNFREVLVIFQFGIALILIVATLTVSKQIEHVGKRDIGYNNAQLMEIPIEGDMTKNYDVIKSELINKGIAQAVTRTGASVTQYTGSSFGNFSWNGASPELGKKIVFNIANTESDLVNTLGLKLVEGRDIDYARLAADSNAVLLNQAAIKEMKLKNPIGSYFKWGSNTFTIVGVIKDYVYDSPYHPVQPLLITASKNNLYNMVVRTNPALSVDQSLEQIKEILKKFNPAYPFEYQFVDQQFAWKLKEQKQVAQLAFIFSFLAIVISCLGLFGLVSYITEVRTKEIGIRKVLGASVTSITTMLSKDFIKLVFIAILIASPIAWWFMNKWLQDFPYRIEMQWSMFFIASMAALTLAIATVSTQSIRAASLNPVKSLHDE